MDAQFVANKYPRAKNKKKCLIKKNMIQFCSLPYVDALSSSSLHRRRPSSSYHRPKQLLSVLSLNNPQIAFSLLLKRGETSMFFRLLLFTAAVHLHPITVQNNLSPFYP
ncbi:hypothetical protein QL285_005005 [Trifolium repens]|jgi:hypothetical protein|nr:hypothetical protein QL285_005005 [Trifolium repens]